MSSRRVHPAFSFYAGTGTTIPEVIPPQDSEIEALQRNVLTLFQQIVAGSPTLSDELSTVAMNIEEPGRLVDFIASSLPSLSTSDKQETLETTDVRVRLEKINQHLAKEFEVQQLRNKIQSEVQDRVQQTQREYYLREQMKAIQKELGEQDESTRDAEELKQKIEYAGMPEEVKKEALKELSRLARCRRWQRTTRSRATISSGWQCCPGPNPGAGKLRSRRRKRYWMPITTTWRK